jgi:hypothetical protein
MKRLLFVFLFFVGVKMVTYAQIGTSVQFSSIPFWGINYEIKDRFKPELRLSTDTYFENVSVEIIATYDILDKEDFELYVGLGGRFPTLSGFVIPVGLYLHPFQKKNFGFIFEITPVFGEDSNLLRGSLGFSYKFDLNGSKE